MKQPSLFRGKNIEIKKDLDSIQIRFNKYHITMATDYLVF